MFESEPRAGTGRYQAEFVSGQFREKKHQEEVQRVLDEGSTRDWRLVSATTTNASGTWVTAVYWDTFPENR